MSSIIWSEYPVGDYRVMCPMCGKRPNVKDMGITINAHDHGIAHCFKCHHVEYRGSERNLTAEERTAFQRRMDVLRRQHFAEQRQRQALAADAASVRWMAAVPATAHPYLSAKNVEAHGVRVEGDHTLLIPMRDTVGRLHSLQCIGPTGFKMFMPGGRTKGCYYAIGKPSGRLVICEGFATGATLHEQTGAAVAIAFTSGNLLAVAKALRAKFPCISLVIAADDDWKTEGNPGMTAATEAARDVGGLLAVPQFGDLPRGERDTDFNDLHRLAGSLEMAE